jgi:hypothetical protein
VHVGGPPLFNQPRARGLLRSGSARDRYPYQNVLITIKNRINLAPRKHAPSQPKTLNRPYVTLGREVAVRIGCSLIP